MIDLNGGQVEVTIARGIQGHTLWVNQDGMCVLRIQSIEGTVLTEIPVEDRGSLEQWLIALLSERPDDAPTIHMLIKTVRGFARDRAAARNLTLREIERKYRDDILEYHYNQNHPEE